LDYPRADRTDLRWRGYKPQARIFPAFLRRRDKALREREGCGKIESEGDACSRMACETRQQLLQKKRKRATVIGLAEENESFTGGEATAAEESTTSIETDLIRKEMSMRIRGIVESLPEKYRTVLVLSERRVHECGNNRYRRRVIGGSEDQTSSQGRGSGKNLRANAISTAMSEMSLSVTAGPLL
jgi:hypothetical protein